METVLKFIESSKPASDDATKHRNELSSRTLLKIAFIDRYWLADARRNGQRTPKAGEMWRCSFTRETNMGTNSGCFLVIPKYVVDPGDLIKLFPGSFTTNFVNGRLIILPKPEYLSHQLMMPLYLRQHLASENGAYAVIVELPSQESETIQPKVHT